MIRLFIRQVFVYNPIVKQITAVKPKTTNASRSINFRASSVYVCRTSL